VTIKVLGQLNPAATTLTALYTVPASTTAVGSTLCVCNQAAVGGTFRASVAVAGAADNAKQYIAYDSAVGANDTVFLTIGITLAATDVVKVFASSGTMSFTLFGEEN
jgi:hypothetical protein